MNEMKFSFIIPFYNADKYIKRCLDSLMRQGLRQDEFEIIIVDDGSTENHDNLNEYIKSCTNIIYIWQENSGPGTARNRGLELAKGEYVFFCDSDDYVNENVFCSLYKIAHENMLDMLFHNRIAIMEGETYGNRILNFNEIDFYPTGKHYFAALKGYIKSGPTFYIIRRNFVNSNNLKFTNGIVVEDTSFFIDAITKAGKVATINVDVYFYIIYQQSLYHSTGKKLQSERYADNIFQFIKKMTSIINKNEKENVPVGFLDNLIRLRDSKTRMMLINSRLYLPRFKACQYTLSLKKIGAYPIKIYRGGFFLKKLLNIPFVWLSLCFITGFISQKYRVKHF